MQELRRDTVGFLYSCWTSLRGRQETVGLDFGHFHPEQPSSANSGLSAQIKTAPEGAAALFTRLL